MKWHVVWMATGLLLVASASEGGAQWFGSKKAKVPPQQRVPELIGILKADKDAHKRADAAEELRQFEVKDFPEILPVLMEALQNDSSTSVRVEAAVGLGRLRPVSVPVGQALEKAAANDPNLLVRIQAKASLVYYQICGYHAPKANEPQAALKPRTDEPPLALPLSGSDAWWKHGAPADKGPNVTVTATPNPNQFRPMPAGPAGNPQVPVVTGGAPLTGPALAPPQPLVLTNQPALQNVPQPLWSAAPEEGPSLAPPK